MRQPVPFGKYLLLDRISVGGMAEVFKAKSYGVEGFEKIIAIKRILPTMGEDRDFIKMFIDEAKIAGQLAHANICQIFELGRIDGSHFIAMEYIWGKDLLQIQNRLRKIKQPMPIPMACFAIAKVLEGLDYAHRKRDPLGRPLEIVHRDCSPQNVLVSYEGEVKVIDFGIAKATSRNSRTMAGVLKGKFGYMSPEQVRGLPLDRRSDIFALGTMLYECLTGERLFQGETDFSTLEKVRNVDIQAPRAINPAIPESVEKVILKALAKDVDDRYQWCSEMLADLQAYLMAQDVVFTAKSLSSWLKEVFATEIERERQQLEQYKRLGRDGLIAGVPAAEAKLDVVEHLGEAGAPEGDATMLGGPNFDELEQAAGAAPNVDIAPPNRSTKSAPNAAPDDDDDGDFGEEAPTEIFGDEVGMPAAAAEAPRAPSQPAGKPPGPPPRAPTQQRPSMPMAAQSSGRTPQPVMDAGMQQMAPAQQMMQPPYGAQQPYGAPAYGTPSQQQPALGVDGVAMGTPGAMPTQQPQQSQQKTVLGMQAPQGLGNYGQRSNQSGPMQPMGPGMQPPMQQQQMQPGMASPMQGYPAQQGYPQQYPQQPYGGYPSGQMQPYPSGQMPVPPVDPTMMPVAEGKKSTLARDIGIGVAIAALVLIGFLVVKIFVLDAGNSPATASSTSTPTTTSTIATVKLSMPPGITAKMFVDDKEIATVEDKTQVPVTAGLRRLKIVGPTGATCDSKVQLEGGKTTLLECVLPSAGGAATGSNTATSGAGATGSGATAGSAEVKTGTTAGSAETKSDTTKSDTKSETKTDAKSGAAETKSATETKTDAKTDTKSGTTETKTDTKASGSTTAAATDKTVDKLKNGHATTDTKTATNGTQHGKTDTKSETKTDTKADKSTATTDTKADTAAADPTKGYLTITSKPVAKILVDGTDTGLKTPIGAHQLPLAPGKHKITFVIGDDRFSYPVTIKAGATEAMNKDLQ